jgi:hypothetical protein
MALYEENMFEDLAYDEAEGAADAYDEFDEFDEGDEFDEADELEAADEFDEGDEFDAADEDEGFDEADELEAAEFDEFGDIDAYLMTSAHFRVSLSMNLAKSAGEPVKMSQPRSAKRVLMLG